MNDAMVTRIVLTSDGRACVAQSTESESESASASASIFESESLPAPAAPIDGRAESFARHGRRVLVIAGSDSSGGAGLEADQKTLAAHCCYALTATTALTAQDTSGVYAVHAVPPSFVAQQIRLCAEDIGIDVVKIGMLASQATVESVADALTLHASNVPIVLDPVMVATSGSQLLPTEALAVLQTRLLPMAAIVTPNVPEAKLLAGRERHADPATIDDMIGLARAVHSLGPRYTLVKGGHFRRPTDIASEAMSQVVDVLYDGQHTTLICKEWIDSKNTHGTGCSLASAIAANLALGESMPHAVVHACQYVQTGIQQAIDRGRGPGPINHFHSSQMVR